MKGATGTVLDPVTQSEIDENNDLDNATEFYREIWQQSVEGGHTEESLKDLCSKLFRSSRWRISWT